MRTEPRADWRTEPDLECPHEDFTENQEGDRTCTACGLTTDAPEPQHPNGCVCADCHDAEMSAAND